MLTYIIKLLVKILKMKLFDLFDKTYCINLKHREDRLTSFNNEVIKFDLGNYERYDAILGSSIRENINSRLLDGEIGIIETNINILNESKKNKFNNVLIIEDDCYFTEDIVKINEFMKFVPDDWDMLYFGGNHNTHMNIKPPIHINDYVVKLHNTYSAHMVGIKSNLFDVIIPLLKNYDKQIDVIYSELQKKYNVYSFYPGVAKQQSGYSDIQKQIVDYNWLIK